MTANDNQQQVPRSAETEAAEIMAEFWVWAKKWVVDVPPDHAPTFIQAFRAGWLASALISRAQALEDAAELLRQEIGRMSKYAPSRRSLHRSIDRIKALLSQPTTGTPEEPFL